MRKIFTLIVGLMLVSVVFAQQPEGLIKKASVAPVIDGVLDDVWAEANVYKIDKPYRTEKPTIGDPGDTKWRGLWTEEGMYIFLTVKDDNWYPSYISGGNNWEFDKPEIYFDVNYVLEDGLGAQHSKGHYQVAPAAVAAKIDGTKTTEGDGVVWAFKVENPNYTAEYFVPFSKLVDKDGGPVDLTRQMGFDVTIIDRDLGDSGRRRAVWANIGTFDESWSNMNEAGLITFDGAEGPVHIDEIKLSSGGSITVDNGTLQINAEIIPDDATVKTLKWTIKPAEGSKGKATISSTGLVTAIMDGKMIVQATSLDGFVYSNEVVVVISGQIIKESDVNIIKNGNFDNVNADGTAVSWGGWTDASPAHKVIDGVSVHSPVESTDVWRYQFSQNQLTALPNIPYIFKFKAWADANRKINVDFEDTSGNNYNRYGSTTDPRSSNGRSDWTFDITTEPVWYKFDVTFDQIVATTDQKVQYMLGLYSKATVYIDSVSLISVADMQLISTKAVKNNLESFKVYPNPAVSKLHIDLSAPNTTVAIYNSVGVKMEEVVVPGTHHIFDVSRYTKGLYFVKANNQVVKFIK